MPLISKKYSNDIVTPSLLYPGVRRFEGWRRKEEKGTHKAAKSSATVLATEELKRTKPTPTKDPAVVTLVISPCSV